MRSALIADVVPLTEKRKADKTQVQAGFPLDWDDHQSTDRPETAGRSICHWRDPCI